jgi:hypothetical protein
MRTTIIKNVYLEKLEKNVFRVDGNYIRNNIDINFNDIGSHDGFKHIPKNEIWIDVEVLYNERNFYIDRMNFIHQHIGSGFETSKKLFLKKELKKRNGKTKNIYIELYQKMDDINIFIVNGKTVRDLYYAGFTGGGHGYVYNWIPKNEIWIDANLNTKDIEPTIVHELYERNIMKKGIDYEIAHTLALDVEKRFRAYSSS